VTVSRFIIHKLSKNEAPQIAPELLDLENEFVSKLADKIIAVYHTKISVVWGRFRHGGQFPTEVKRIEKIAASDDRFKGIAAFSMRRLQEEMTTTAGTGGFICFIEYTKNGCNQLMIAMIKNTDGIKLNGLVPTGDIHVDLSRLYQAINMNFNLYFLSLKEKFTPNYLGFIGKKGDSSDYFTDAFSGTDKVSPSQAVTKSHKALKSFLRQYTDKKPILKEAHETLVSYLNENINKTVTLEKVNEIANIFLPEEHADKKDSFIEYAKSDSWQIPDTFQAATGVVTRLAKIRVDEPDYSLIFRRNKLGIKGDPKHVQRSIVFDEDGRTVTIRNLSDEAMNTIKEEIQEDMDDTERTEISV
jgi:nucleoid-associated protein